MYSKAEAMSQATIYVRIVLEYFIQMYKKVHDKRGKVL